MDIKKVVQTLEDMKKRYAELKKLPKNQGEAEYEKMSNLLVRIVDRVYPEKDARYLKNNLYIMAHSIGGIPSPAEEQKEFLQEIDLKMQVIDTILQESELFGFDDFKPVKEKTEIGGGINAGIFSFGAKKTKAK